MFTRPQRELSRALMLSRAHMLHDVHKTPTQSSHAWMPNAWDGKRSASIIMYVYITWISGVCERLGGSGQRGLSAALSRAGSSVLEFMPNMALSLAWSMYSLLAS